MAVVEKRDPEKDLLAVIDTEDETVYIVDEKSDFFNDFDPSIKWDKSNDRIFRLIDGDEQFIKDEKLAQLFRDRILRLIQNEKTEDYQSILEWQIERKKYEEDSLEREMDGDSYDILREDE